MEFELERQRIFDPDTIGAVLAISFLSFFTAFSFCDIMRLLICWSSHKQPIMNLENKSEWHVDWFERRTPAQKRNPF